VLSVWDLICEIEPYCYFCQVNLPDIKHMDITRTIHDKMMKERLLFAFRGDVTDRNSLPLLTLLENEMKDDSYGFIGRKRLFMYVLENLQNIAKHGDHLSHSRMSLVTYSKTDDGYTITTGNLISSDHVDNLRIRLEEVNKLDVNEVKDLYLQIMNNAEFSEKGGAGLGLLEMAVKTGNKLDYHFEPVDKDFSYFILSKTVNSSGMGVHSGNSDNDFKTNPVVQLDNLMAEKEIHMIWSGHITSGISEEVLSLTESRLAEEDIDYRLRRRVFNIMVEILENVQKYNPGREPEEKHGMPVAMVRLEDNKFILTTGNLILKTNVSDLKEKLDTINSYDRAGLKDLFYKSLSEQSMETDSTGNMGLIEMARKSGSKLDYQFGEVNELYSYFMLTVKVEDHLD
jgi:hypothetical protein